MKKIIKTVERYEYIEYRVMEENGRQGFDANRQNNLSNSVTEKDTIEMKPLINEEHTKGSIAMDKIDSKEEDNSRSDNGVPIDRGWAWMVLLGIVGNQIVKKLTVYFYPCIRIERYNYT